MDATLPPPTADPAAAAHESVDASDGTTTLVDGRIVGGVASLIAHRFGVDALWVRIAFVLLALVGGLGLLLYAGLWLALVAAPLTPWRAVAWLGGAIVILGVPYLIAVADFVVLTGPLAVVLLLAGLAVALWQPRRGVAASPVAIPVPGADVAGSARRTRPKREPSLLGRAVFGAAIVVAAVGALIDDANGGRLHPEQWLGAAALVCSIGLLIGTLASRARWLVAPALLFAGSGFVGGELARMHVGLDAITGDEWVYVTAGEPITATVAATGFDDASAQIDSAVTGDHRVAVRSAFSNAYVWVGGPDVRVEVRSRADHGGTWFDGQLVDDGVVVVNPEADGDDVIVVDAWARWGDVVITRTFLPDVYEAVGITVPPPTPLATIAPGRLGALTPVDDYLSATADGWIVILNGEAVIDPDDQVVAGQTYPGDEGFDQSGQPLDGTIIETSVGQFRLLPRSLLMTPDRGVIDLRAVRDSLSAPPQTTLAMPPPLNAIEVVRPTVPPTMPTIETVPPIPPTTAGVKP